MVTTKEILLKEVQNLSENQIREILNYVYSLKGDKPSSPEGKSISYLLTFAGKIDSVDLKKMAEEIDIACERVDVNEW